MSGWHSSPISDCTAFCKARYVAEQLFCCRARPNLVSTLTPLDSSAREGKAPVKSRILSAPGSPMAENSFKERRALARSIVRTQSRLLACASRTNRAHSCSRRARNSGKIPPRAVIEASNSIGARSKSSGRVPTRFFNSRKAFSRRSSETRYAIFS